MGADRNESEDAADFLRLVEPLVERWHPDFSRLFRHGDEMLEPLVDSVLSHHLAPRPAGARWGWKLCETLYILPVLARIFPDAWFVHLVRDGRDVAFSNHVAPVTSFWRKIYFDTAEITSWRGMPLTYKAYYARPHVFNARHWVSSVTTARHYGAMLGGRYLEVRYEDLVRAPEATARNLLGHLLIDAPDALVKAFAASVSEDRVGRHAVFPRSAQREALAVLRPTLTAFGYDDPAELPRPAWRRLPRWI
jgi:hypothetical protein